VRGARWVHDNILDADPDADLQVFAIWQSVYAADRVGLRPDGVLDDPRVMHLWDHQLVVGEWFGARGELGAGEGLAWDAFMLFDPDATFETLVDHLEASGHTIIDDSHELTDAFDD
jgi:hypothetical protein